MATVNATATHTRLLSYDQIMLAVPDYEALSDALLAQIEQTGAPADVLEVGSGTGLLTKRLLASPHIARVTCVDPDDEACDRLSAVYGHDPRLTVFRGGLEVFRPRRRFDIAIGRFALHHVRDALKAPFLERLRLLLRANGRLILGDMTLPHYADAAARRRAVDAYYDVTIDYSRTLGHEGLLHDQIDCRAHDKSQNGEYKICACRMGRAIVRAGFTLDDFRLLSSDRAGGHPVGGGWPGLIVAVGRAGAARSHGPRAWRGLGELRTLCRTDVPHA